MSRSLCMAMVLVFMGLSLPVGAATYNIYVTPAGDQVNYRAWWYGGNDTWSNVGANPNEVYHSYSPGDGRSANTSLSFDLSSFSLPADDILSASFNFNVLSISTEGRDDIGTLDSYGTVLYSGGTGWKSFDITDSFKGILSGGGNTANYTFSYTGYSGFTFSSAEGGNPAFLQIATAELTPVPVPAALWLMGSGLLGLFGLRKKIE
jgi:hypothetical protein